MENLAFISKHVKWNIWSVCHASATNEIIKPCANEYGGTRMLTGGCLNGAFSWNWKRSRLKIKLSKGCLGSASSQWCFGCTWLCRGIWHLPQGAQGRKCKVLGLGLERRKSGIPCLAWGQYNPMLSREKWMEGWTNGWMGMEVKAS